MTDTINSKRGPKELFAAEKRETLVKALRAVRDGAVEGTNMPSRFLLKRMEERELVAFDTVKSGKRGRPAHVPVLTRAGVAFLATV